MAQHAPDVVIYVPGLGQNGPDQSAEMVAARIAHAEDMTSEPKYTFTAKAAEDFEFATQKARRVRIIRGANGEPDEPAYDVYTFPYIETLIAGSDKRNPFVQALSVFWVIARHSPRMLLSLFSKGKSLREKAQVVYAALLYVLLFVYMVSLLYAAVGGAFDALKLAGYDIKPIAMQGPVSGAIEAVVIVLTALGLWSKKDTKATLDRVAIETTAVAKYLHDGERAGSLHDRLETLIQKIVENGGYRNIHIIGYSFGSVVVLDTLFATNRELTPALAEVETLVTIGCPFDFVRTFWPSYFDGRTSPDGVPYTWLNIYDPNDILGSNFADTVKGVDQDRGIRAPNTQQYLPTVNFKYETKQEAGEGFWAWVQLAGFRAHGHYWEKGDVFDRNCFRTIVKQLRTSVELPKLAAGGE